MAANAIFGTTDVLGAFTVASQIPNLIRSLVADSALGAAFVPVFSELREHDEEERAWRVASAVATWILVLLGPLVVLCMVLTPYLVKPFINEAEIDLQLTIDLTRIMLPIILLMALSGVVVGVLNSYDHFSSPALAPVAWNAVILIGLIVAATVVSTPYQVYVYAIAVTVGTVVQLVLPVPWLRGRGGRLQWTLLRGDPRIRQIFLLMLPVTIGLGLINLQLLIATAFASHVPASTLPGDVTPGAGPAILENAFRLYMLPQGVFSVAVSTVFFPALARYAARADMDGFRATFSDGLRQIVVLLAPASALLIFLAEPIVRLLYEHGKFNEYSTQAVSDVLVMLSLGLVLNGASLLLIRAFFSLKKTWVPTAVSILTLAVNVLLVLVFYKPLGVAGIALATSIVNVVSFGVLFVLLRKAAGRLEGLATLKTTIIAVGASVATAWLGSVVWRAVDQLLGRDMVGQLCAMAAALGVAYAMYVVIIARLKLIDQRLITGRFKR